MRADKLVYLLLQLAPQGFFALIGRNPRAYLDELPETEAMATGLFKLPVELERTAGEAARRMVEKAKRAES